MPSSGGTISRRSAPSRRRGPQRQRTAAAANAEDDTEEVRALRAKYPTQLAMLSELFPSWTDEDLLFVISESSGIVEVAVGRISEGHAEQFSSVKSKKTQRKEAAAAAAAATPSVSSSDAHPNTAASGSGPAAASTSTTLTSTSATTTPGTAPGAVPDATAGVAITTSVPGSTTTQSLPTHSQTHVAPPIAGAGGVLPEGSRRTGRGGDRSSRGRGASTPAARAGRGGFRGVARGGGVSSAPASAPSAQSRAMPVTTTPAAFGGRPKSSTSSDTKASGTATTPVPGSSSTSARPTTMSWAQIARPAEPKPAATSTATTTSTTTDHHGSLPGADSAATATDAAGAHATPKTDTVLSPDTSATAGAPTPGPTGATEADAPESRPSVSAATLAPAPGPASALSASASTPSAAAASSVPSRSARPQRPRQDAAVVMPGGTSLDQLDMKFGTLNFMANDNGDVPESGLSTHAGVPLDAKHEDQQPVNDFDAFKSNGFGMDSAYGTGLSTTRPMGQEAASAVDDTSVPLSYGASGNVATTAAGAPQGYSSMYGFDSHERSSHPYTTGLRTSTSADDRTGSQVAGRPSYDMSGAVSHVPQGATAPQGQPQQPAAMHSHPSQAPHQSSQSQAHHSQQQQQQQQWRHVRPARHTKAPLGSGPTPWLMTTGEHVHVRAYLHALFGRHCDKATYQEAENALLAQLEESRDADDEACTALHDILRVQVDRVLHQRMVRAIIF